MGSLVEGPCIAFKPPGHQSRTGARALNLTWTTSLSLHQFLPKTSSASYECMSFRDITLWWDQRPFWVNVLFQCGIFQGPDKTSWEQWRYYTSLLKLGSHIAVRSQSDHGLDHSLWPPFTEVNGDPVLLQASTWASTPASTKSRSWRFWPEFEATIGGEGGAGGPGSHTQPIQEPHHERILWTHSETKVKRPRHPTKNIKIPWYLL